MKKKLKYNIVCFIMCLSVSGIVVACGSITKTPKITKTDQIKENLSKDERDPIIVDPIVVEPELMKASNTTLAFAGDTMLMKAALANYEGNGIDGILDPKYQELFQTADIGMLNEEFPFSNRGTPMADKEYTFRINPEYVDWYSKMGIDIVSLANNHALDFGKDALMDTFSTLDQAEIKYVGAGSTKERAKETQFIEKNEIGRASCRERV